MIFIPPLEEGFEYCVLPSGYHSIKIPGLTKLCDTLDCSLSNTNVNILSCGHAYHASCLDKIDNICKFCFDYYSEGIDDLTSSFNDQLLSEVEIQENMEEEINIYNNNKIEEECLEPNTDIDCDLVQSIDAFIRNVSRNPLSNTNMSTSTNISTNQQNQSSENKRKKNSLIFSKTKKKKTN